MNDTTKKQGTLTLTAPPPRTMMNGKPVFEVAAKTAVNFDSRFDKKLLCDGITFTAGNACVYDCTFCYVTDMQRKAREWHEKQGVVYPPEGHSGVVIRIKSAVELVEKQILSKPEAYRRSKKVIYSSPKVDVAGNMELVRETVAICKVILKHTDWDVRLLTKSSFLPKLHTLLCEGGGEDAVFARMIYGVSTGTLNDKLAAAFELDTALVSKRIASLHTLQEMGCRTFGMICPSLPQDNYFAFSDSMASALRVDRLEHVWAEPMNVRGDNFARTDKVLREAKFNDEADRLAEVCDPAAWEVYARRTFEGHTAIIPPSKLRFLQYVNPKNQGWWAERKPFGAVLL